MKLNIGLTVGAIACALMAPPVVFAQAPGMAQTPGFKSKPVHTAPITGDDAKEIVLISVAIEPGGYSPAHVHPGDCAGMVFSGNVEVVIDGKESRRFGPGEAFGNVRGTVHQFKNVGDTPVQMVNALVVDKGKPRTQPPPKQ
jgi:quercetin dioxygenase-like cupin family protein